MKYVKDSIFKRVFKEYHRLLFKKENYFFHKITWSKVQSMKKIKKIKKRK